jgi:2-polyprenyl-6-methoxyphenol hydroxylase-like FAD-dependent oxidoreductase
VAEFDTDALTVGAGPVGMVFASEMARWKVACRIVDKKPTTVQHSNAVGVQISCALDLRSEIGTAGCTSTIWSRSTVLAAVRERQLVG